MDALEQMVRTVLRLPEDQAHSGPNVSWKFMEPIAFGLFGQGSSDLQTHRDVVRMDFARRQAQLIQPAQDLASISFHT